jgi:DNA polymerase-3 subunit alpha
MPQVMEWWLMISAAVHECRRMGIQVLPPDINESAVDFTISDDKGNLEENGIRFGLSAIKHVGKAAIEAILEVRDEGEFLSFADFLSRVDARRVNKKVLESLIKVGALSAYGKRAALLASYEEIRNKVSKPKASKGQQGLFSQDEITKSTKSQNVQIMEDIDEFSDEELQALERQLLGFSLSARPLSEVLSPIEHKATHKIFEISPHETIGEKVRLAAIVSEVKIIVTRRSGQEMAFVRIEDDTGSLELVVFPKIFSQTRDHWVDNKALIVSGRVDNREDAPTLIVETIETSADTKDKNNDNVYIKVPKKAKASELSQLKKLLIKYPGDQAVVLVFEGRKEEKVKLPYKINWNARLARMITEALEGNSAPDVQ